MKRILFIASALLAAMVVAQVGAASSSAQGQSGGSPDTYVTYWDVVGTQAFTAAGLTPAEGHVIFAYVAIAVYDSVIAIEGGYRPFAIDVDATAGASAETAVAAAAHRILAHYLPAQAPGILDPAFTASLDSIPDGQAKTDGMATGEQVAALLIAERADDGFRAPVTYTPPDPPIPDRRNRRRRRHRRSPSSKSSTSDSASSDMTPSGTTIWAEGSSRSSDTFTEHPCAVCVSVVKRA